MLDDIKKVVDGDSMIGRIKYRRQVGNAMSGKRPAIAKNEVFRSENAHAEFLEDKVKNENFGFKCLHYSVSESSGTLQIHVQNKKGTAGRVRVRTKDKEAEAGKDYEAVDELLTFNKADMVKFVTVKINDDENWEPDEDFLVELFDEDTGERLSGQDTITRVTIIDDDKPGQIAFAEHKTIRAIATKESVEIKIIRKNGSDGLVTVDYESV